MQASDEQLALALRELPDIAPPPGVYRKIEARLAAADPMAPDDSTSESAAPVTKPLAAPRRFIAPLAAAAACVAAIGVTLVVFDSQTTEPGAAPGLPQNPTVQVSASDADLESLIAESQRLDDTLRNMPDITIVAAEDALRMVDLEEQIRLVDYELNKVNAAVRDRRQLYRERNQLLNSLISVRHAAIRR